MRKINKNNKKAFGAFGAIVLILLVGFGAVMVFAIINSSDSFAAEKGLVIYDSNSELINTETEGTIKKSWSSAYFLSLKGGDKYDLGEHSVAFVPRNREVKIYGSGYQVKTDGSVQKIDNETKIPNKSIESKLFKLADRRYLITGGDIVCVDQNFQTRTYLDIYIDKSGNAQLLNNEVNMKTVKPMTLVCGDITFDIGNEKMLVGEKEIDLKAIGGSTNKYKEEEEKKDNSTSGGNSTTNNNQSTTSGGTGGGGTSTSTDKNIEKSITLRGTQADISSIKVNYSITDIENNYVSCYLLVDEAANEEDEPTRIELNKADNTINVRGLKPDTLYEISLCYDTYVKTVEGTTLKQNIQNVVRVKTATVEADITIERLTKEYLTIKVSMDEKYVLDSADLVVYGDKDKVAEASIDIKKATSGGWVKKVYIGDNYKTIDTYTVKIENGMYSGEAISVNGKYVVKNSFFSFVLSKLTNISN